MRRSVTRTARSGLGWVGRAPVSGRLASSGSLGGDFGGRGEAAAAAAAAGADDRGRRC